MDHTGTSNILEVEGLTVRFSSRAGKVHAVTDLGFTVAPGELLGIVGESGSGKSVAMMSLLGLLPSPPAIVESQRVLFSGRDLHGLDHEEMRQLRGGDIGFVFQDPMTSLNPVLTVGYQLAEPLRQHLGMDRAAAHHRAAELLELVGIPDGASRLGDYPHQFSGGMRQRVGIAMALSCDPKLLIADEPTTALDVTIQAQILDLVRDLRQRLGMAIIWITHDLGVVAGIADRVAVMYGGQIVECAGVAELFARPRHPYTQALLATLPGGEAGRGVRLRTIQGQPPILRSSPASCTFAPRCDHVHDRCHAERPLASGQRGVHTTACWLEAANS